MIEARLKVKAVPGASRDEIAGYVGERLKVRVQAPAEAGRANEAICRLLARLAGVRTRAVRIERGLRNAEKTVVIEGVTEDMIRRAVERESDER